MTIPKRTSNDFGTGKEHLIIGGSIYPSMSRSGKNSQGLDQPSADVSDDNLAFYKYPEDADGNPLAVTGGEDEAGFVGTQTYFPSVFTNSVSSYKGLFNKGTWRGQHGMSLDGLFIPYSTNFLIEQADGSDNRKKQGTPSFEAPYTSINIEGKVVQQADYGTDAKTGTSANLNPFAKGHNIAHLVRGSKQTDLSVQKAGDQSASGLGSISSGGGEGQRPIGLRGPVVVVGWGYDTDGLPVPNAELDGINKESDYLSPNFGKPKGVPAGMPSDSSSFLNNHMKAMSDWKSGPVDLRWDRDRKVWVGGKFNGIYLSKATRCILPEAGPDGVNSFNFGVAGNINIGGRLYRNPCPEEECTWETYFPRSSLYPDIEVYDPEDRDWCGVCRVGLDGTTICNDWADTCMPFYDAVIIRSIEHYIGGKDTYTNCGDKFNRAGADPVRRRAGNPCHGWGGAYEGRLENINTKIAKDSTFSSRAKSILYEKIFIENPLNQGLMIGDSFLSYDTGRRVSYTYVKSSLPTCDTAGDIEGEATAVQVTEKIPVHVILQGEFFGMETVTRSGCEQGEVTACSRKFFAQGFATMEDCGPDDDYPQTAVAF